MFADFRVPPGNLDLPTTERELASVIGRSAAMRLSWRVWQMNSYRGRGKRGVLYIPAKPTKTFVARVGDAETSEALIRRFGVGQLELTGCHGALKRLRTYMVRKLIAHGARRCGVTKAAGMTDRQVRRLCTGEAIADAWPVEEIASHLVGLYAFNWMMRVDPHKG